MVTHGSDLLQLGPDDVPATGRTQWLTDALRTVAHERLSAGSPLPASRRLAAELGLARGVVVEAYRRLTEEGLATARIGAGTVIATRPSPVPTAQPMAPPAATTEPTEVVLPPGDSGTAIDLSPGVPDLAAFPRSAWLRAERSVLSTVTSGDLGYGDPRGHPRLRSELAAHLGRTRGLRISPDEVLVVAGVAQALALLCHVAVRRGVTSAAMEDPGSRGVRDELSFWGVRPVPVPVDGDGIDVDALIGTGERMVVTTPAHQFPTGVVLSPVRRPALIDWARQRGGLIVEDDYDAEHRYDRPPVPALQASAPDCVIHAGSTSKALAPGLRLGWMIAPPCWRSELVAARHASDIASPSLPQLVLAELLASGSYERHLRSVRLRQRRRRDAVVESWQARRPELSIEGVAAGLHLLVRLPPDIDDEAVAEAALAHGVRVQPLSWHQQQPGGPGLVIGYAAQSPDVLRTAIHRILDVLP